LFLALLAAFLAVAKASSPDTADPSRHPVILVHGIGDNGRTMNWMGRRLRAAGWEVHSVTLKPNLGQIGIDEMAEQVAAFIDQTVPRGARIDLVGFSMGGLVSRYYVQRLGGFRRVDHFVSISAPHHGTILACLVPDPACRQMRPGSDFLRDLAGDADRLGCVRCTSLWTPLDLTIIPASSSVLPVGNSQRIWCLAHPLMIRSSNSLRAVEAALRG
jgi:triacylglycerol lipase